MPAIDQVIADRSETASVIPFAFRQGLALGRLSKHVFERELETTDKQGLHGRQVWERDIEVQPTKTLSTLVTSLDAINPNELVQVVTTTLFTGPTVAVAPAPHSVPVPVGAIAGGVAGGVVLAMIIVAIWKFWGRKIDKDETKKRKKLTSIRNAIAYRRHFTSRASRNNRPAVDGFGRSRNSSWSNGNPENRRVSFSPPAELQTREKKDSLGSTAGSTLASKISSVSTPSTVVSTNEDNDSKSSSILVPSSPKPLKPVPTNEVTLKSSNRPTVGRATTSENRYAPFRPSPLAFRSPLSGSKTPRSPSLSTSPNGSVPLGNSGQKSVATATTTANHQSKPSDGLSVSSASVYSTQSLEKDDPKPDNRPVVWPKRSSTSSSASKERPAAFSFSSKSAAASAAARKGPEVTTHKSTTLPIISTDVPPTPSSVSKSSPTSPLPTGAATPHLAPPPVPLPRTLPTTATSPNDPTRISTFTYSSGSAYSAASEETTSTSRWSWLLKSPAVSTIHPPLLNQSTGSLSTAPTSSAAAAVIAARNARSVVIDEFVDEEEENEVNTGIAV